MNDFYHEEPSDEWKMSPNNSYTTTEKSFESLAPSTSSPYSHVETHHVIRFKKASPSAPISHSKIKERMSNKRREALMAVKKRLRQRTPSEEGLGNDSNHRIIIETNKSRLKSGRGRSPSRNRRIDRFRRSLSTIRRKKLSSGDSVCSTQSNRSIRSIGSRALKKVRSFRKNISFRRKRHSDKKDNFYLIKETWRPQPKAPITSTTRKKGRNDSDRGILSLGFLCESFYDVFDLCGNHYDERQEINRSHLDLSTDTSYDNDDIRESP